MISFEELTEQNHKIAELAKVLSFIINDRELCDTDVTCDLFFDFVDKVQTHLDVEDRELYIALLTHNDITIKNTATRFLSGSGEIKRVFKQYLRRWCKNKALRIKDYERFTKDTHEMFTLILQRIEDETIHLYPTVRAVRQEQKAA
ncbi:MAG: Unknown protein [uncultured Thiotrichaceae bacterium]|uniref:Hemerythrin-like domain-containing protein n=1 Tax=uncultured Thiotrichaceae bacterium TaxID=298394 RepID=A0A6S6SMC6_9GAMM|nr:MAG: Unknown protein [uncultured Thiotrichaceae bacterium]